MKKRSRNKASTCPRLLDGRIMLRVHEYSELTGTPIASVYKYAKSGELPTVKLGNTIRISVEAIRKQLGAAE